MKKAASNLKKSSGDECVVCFRAAEIVSVGECDHPVCFECSTRMRVLVKQKECPICRKEMSQVRIMGSCLIMLIVRTLFYFMHIYIKTRLFLILINVFWV